MNFLRITIISLLFTLSFNAKALVITETIQFNKNLDYGWHDFTFDFSALGYDHRTDTITLVGESYEFLELVDDGYDPDDISTWESVQFNSHIFEGRVNEHDLTPGISARVASWNKLYQCQYERQFSDECLFNLDLTGKARESLGVFTDNLWLGEVKLWIEIDRISLPEPSTIFLLTFGLFSMAIIRAKL